MAGALDSDGNGALVFGAGASLAARADFTIFQNVSAQHFCVLIVDDSRTVGAELAHARRHKVTATAAVALVGVLLVAVTAVI